MKLRREGKAAGAEGHLGSEWSEGPQGWEEHRGESHEEKLQFLPYFGDKTFGDYVIDNESTLVNVGSNAKVMKKQASCNTLMQNIKGVKQLSLHLAAIEE
jgi:hypothetical protein